MYENITYALLLNRMLEKARAAGPGLEKERGRRRYSVMGSAETSPVCFRLPVIDS